MFTFLLHTENGGMTVAGDADADSDSDSDSRSA
jgi:hypothetical protein